MKRSHRVIQIVAIAHIIIGVILPFIGKNEAIATLLVSEMFPGLTLSGPIHSQAAYVIALFGPTVASWGILLLVLANSFFSSPTNEKWFGLFAAVSIWFIGDTTYSMMHGVSAAFILNGVVAVSLLVPIWLSRGLTFNRVTEDS